MNDGPLTPPPTAFDIAAVAKAIGQLNARYTRAHVEGDVPTIDAMLARDAACRTTLATFARRGAPGANLEA